MPLRPSARMASIISCRCIEASHSVIAGTVGDGRILELQIDHDVQSTYWRRFAAARQDVEDHLVAGRARVECFEDRSLDRFQPISRYGGQNADKAAVGLIPTAKLAPQPGKRWGQIPVLERRTVPCRS